MVPCESSSKIRSITTYLRSTNPDLVTYHIYGNLININIQEGDAITKGMQIAQMGLNKTKAHGVLIFEARKDGIIINPDKYFLT